jgi:hypothetical protein
MACDFNYPKSIVSSFPTPNPNDDSPCFLKLPLIIYGYVSTGILIAKKHTNVLANLAIPDAHSQI